jgi:DNA (cytosine-5)-methyltransferase 1
VTGRLLDLFCGAGGASVGYHRAGFEVVGVDIQPQPNYPFEFHQADAMTYPLDGFDVIHASPPCQAFTVAQVIHGNKHDDLLTPTRERLIESGLPWIIENVPGAPMRRDVVLCGSMFGERRLRRHRWFAMWCGTPALLTPPCNHGPVTVSVFGHGGHVYNGVAEWREVMGIDWMTRDELAQAIPPAYTELLGRHVLEQIRAVTQ